VLAQELPTVVPGRRHPAGPAVVGQLDGELAHAPAGEGLLECFRSRDGRRDDERSSSGLIRRGQPPAHSGAMQARPISLNR
jgi:hypothetical protein